MHDILCAAKLPGEIAQGFMAGSGLDILVARGAQTGLGQEEPLKRLTASARLSAKPEVAARERGFSLRDYFRCSTLRAYGRQCRVIADIHSIT